MTNQIPTIAPPWLGATPVGSHSPAVEWDTSCLEVTADGSVSQRIDFWREMILRLFADVQIQAVPKADFFGSVRQRKCSKLRLSEIHAAEQAVKRHYRQARSEGEDKYFGVLMLEGSQSVEQDGKVVTLHPGEFALYDATRPHHLHFSGTWREIVVSIPRPALGQLVVGVDDLMATPIAIGDGVGKIMGTFLEGMSSQMTHIAEEEMLRLSETAISLIAMTMGSLRRNDATQSRLKAVTLMRVKKFVRENLQMPELNPQMIEQATGLSSRYINRLFEPENTSLMRYVWQMRLERCAEELASQRSVALRVSDVAMKWGFNDMSHFSRAFKERFDASPREWQGRDRTRG